MLYLLGCALLSSRQVISPDIFLTSREREVADYWMCTPFCDDHLVNVEFLEFAKCAEPVKFMTKTLDYGTPSIFGAMSTLTLQHLLRNGTVGGGTFEERFASWSNRYHIPELSCDCTVIVMPTPHALSMPLEP